MKKLFILSLGLAMGMQSFSQDLESIAKLADDKKYPAAKEAIDKYMTNPKNASEAQAWFYKGNIYNNYSNETTIPSAQSYELKVGALDAYKKTQQLDKVDLYMKMQQFKPYLFVYSGFYNLGAKQFNEKDFAGAYKSFEKAVEVEEFIKSKKYAYDEIKFAAIDTFLLVNLGAAARNSQNFAGAEKAYRKITDANITGPDFEDTYQFLVSYYRQEKDSVNYLPMLAKAKANYPKNTLWSQLEMEQLSQGGDKTALLAKYDEIWSKDPSVYDNAYNYSVEMYNSLYGKDVNNPDPALKTKLTTVLKSAIAADTAIDATMLMANHLYNDAAELSAEASLVKGAKPEDIKKKKDLNALAFAKMDEVIPYAEAAIKYYQQKPPVKTSQKINLKNAADYLSEIYGAKNNPKKAAEYEAIKSAIKF